MQSFHVGLPCLKLSLSPSTQKHHGKAAKTCSVGDAWKEMNDEREGRDKTIDHELTKDNVWLCGNTDMDLEQVIQTARVFNGLLEMVTSLYKDPVSGCYLFVVYRGGSDNASFDRACNMLSEYAALEEADSTILAYVTEHGRPVILGNALEQLAEL